MSDNPRGYVEQRLFLPKRLWNRVEALCDSTDREPSEVVADALRVLLSGGLPMAPASVGGTADPATASTETELEAIAPAQLQDAESLFAQVRDEPLDSARLRQRVLQVIHTIEQRDQFPDGHAEAVAELARLLAETLGLAPLAVTAIELAALGHDLGKGRVPEAILGKRGRLSTEEWDLVRRYPEFSAEMLGQCSQLGQVADIVRHHQERWNGSGYPDGQQGDQISVGAQIVGICDVFHVLTSERAYRPALTPDIARRTIAGSSGRLWNPDLAGVFLDKVIKR